MATERLDIVISEKGGKVVERSINNVGKSAEKSSQSFDLLKRAIGAIGTGLAIRQITQLADSYTTMQNRLKTVTKGQEELNEATEELFRIANRTRNSVQGTVEFYARLSSVAQRLGRSQSELLRVTETVNQAVALSGATTSEAAGALRQFSQGLGSGTLRGEELNSVLEQLPILADIIAERLGVTRGELRGLAEQGRLTSEVLLSALEGASDGIAERFSQSVPTISAAFTVLNNNLTKFVGETDQATGVSQAMAQSIQLLANNLNIVIPLLVTIGGIIVFNTLASQASAFATTISSTIPLLRSLSTALLGVAAAQTAVTASGGSAGFFAATNALASGGTVSAAAASAGGGLAATLGVAGLKIAAVVAAAYGLVKGLDLAAEGSKELIADFSSGSRGLRNMTSEAERLNLVLRSTADNTNRLQSVLQKPKQIADINAAAEAYKELNREQLQFEAARDLGRRLSEDELFGVAKGILERRRASQFADDFKLLPDEIAGSRSAQTASQIDQITQRIEALNRAKQAGVISSEELAKAEGFQREKLDELSGGIEKQLRDISRQIEFFKQAKGDLELSNLFANNDPEVVQRLIDQKSQLNGLIEAEKQKTAATEAAQRAEEARAVAVERTVEALRQQVALFGQTANQQQLSTLRQQGATPGQLAEVESLQKQAALLQQFSDIVGGGTALFAQIVAFQEQATALQSQTAGVAASVQAEAATALAEGTLNIANASQTLFSQVGAFLNSAADLALVEVESKFTAGATTIGTATAQAFASAFSAGLTGALSSVLGSLGASLGGGGALAGGIAAAGNGGTINPALQAQINAIEDAKNRVTQLRSAIANIGPTATNSFNQASAGAQSFGQNTTNIGQQFNTVFGNAFGSLEGALTSFVTTGKFDFKSLINSMLADLARLVVQMLIIRPLMGMFGGFFGGIFGFAQGGFVSPSLALPGFATGGIVGGFGGSTSDNILARLSPGEFVMNAAATKRNRGAFEYINRTGQMPAMNGGAAVTIVNNVTVNSQGGDGQQVGQDVTRQLDNYMRAQVVKILQEQRKPGGILRSDKVR